MSTPYKRCKGCFRLRDEVGRISKRGWCVDCRRVRAIEAAELQHEGERIAFAIIDSLEPPTRRKSDRKSAEIKGIR